MEGGGLILVIPFMGMGGVTPPGSQTLLMGSGCSFLIRKEHRMQQAATVIEVRHRFLSIHL